MTTPTNEPSPSGPPPETGLTPEERTWATMAHVAAIIGLFATAGVLAVLGPLLVWMAKKDESKYVAHHGLEALNFQITMLIVGAALFVAGWVTCGLGWKLSIVAWVLNLVFSIIGAVRANDGERWTYPFSLRLVT
jgi:uncharacterized protein